MTSAGPALRASVASLSLGVLACVGACEKTKVDVFVKGFDPEAVRFEIDDQGALSADALQALVHRGDIDGSLLLPSGSCAGPCRVAIVSIFAKNSGAGADAPPVVRLDAPPGRVARLPLAFRGGEISPGRIGRIRWVVEMWPEEQHLIATLSSSVFLTPQVNAAPPLALPSVTAAPSPAAPSPTESSPAPAGPEHP